MTELAFTRHALEKLKILNISPEYAYGLFINSNKCSVSEQGWKRKQVLNHHQMGSQLYRNNDHIMVIKKNTSNEYVLITIYRVEDPTMLGNYKIKD